MAAQLAHLDKKAQQASAFLSVFANKRRIETVYRLREGELSVGELANQVGLSQSALSQHLAKFRALNLVKTRRDGQTIYYRLSSQKVEQLISTLDDLFSEIEKK